MAFGAKAKDPAPLSDSERMIPLIEKSFSPILIVSLIVTSKRSAKRVSSHTFPGCGGLGSKTLSSYFFEFQIRQSKDKAKRPISLKQVESFWMSPALSQIHKY